MTLPVLFFYLFAAVTVFSGVMVVSSRNPVHAVLFLILGFFSAAGLFVLLGAELIAMLLVIVYVGAVAVLFLFVVMMLDINIARMKEGYMKYLPVGVLVALVLFTELCFAVYASIRKVTLFSLPHASEGSVTNTEALGNILYTDNIMAFQIAGLILLVAMIGAIVLTLRHREGVKRQSADVQIHRKPRDTVRLVKIKPGSGA
ncbi:MAG: NADH-quinone oxidoreductase subunit J [Hyphomicrobiales bacterium]|nr:NADH-quinone oxidoreductase subunit J [Hyphomicrobiales bacterium]